MGMGVGVGVSVGIGVGDGVGVGVGVRVGDGVKVGVGGMGVGVRVNVGDGECVGVTRTTAVGDGMDAGAQPVRNSIKREMVKLSCFIFYSLIDFFDLEVKWCRAYPTAPLRSFWCVEKRCLTPLTLVMSRFDIVSP